MEFAYLCVFVLYENRACICVCVCVCVCVCTKSGGHWSIGRLSPNLINFAPCGIGGSNLNKVKWEEEGYKQSHTYTHKCTRAHTAS